jgi:hypothetical protein
MEEHGEDQREVRDYIKIQVKFFAEIQDKPPLVSVHEWLGFKLGCSARDAASAIVWADEA